MKVIDKDVVLEDKKDYVQSFNTTVTKKRAKTAPSERIVYVKSTVLCIALALLAVGCAVAVVCLAREMDGVVPAFYPSEVVFAVLTVVCYLSATVGLLCACRQGANKKVYILYAVNAILNIALLVSLMIFGLKILSLFLALFVFYFAFTLTNELKKVNTLSFYAMMPYALWTTFLAVCAYALVMLN